jgi:pimeloyl-ACP methyl ester carboxylesterase
MTTPLVDEAIRTASGWTFDAYAAGPREGEGVLMLHGYPQTRDTWREQIPALAQAGYRVIAPNQRGYSAGARPAASDLSQYHFDLLVRDALEIAEAAGIGDRRFHLVGHDWGGQVAWGVADRHPQRLASLTILSRPHPVAFASALQAPDGDQKHRSRHHRAFLDPKTARLLLEDNARRLRSGLVHGGVPETAVDRYLAVLADPEALEAALAWYRASRDLRADIGSIAVPTLYLWGDADATVGPAAAHGTGEQVAAAYRMEVLPGIGHFATDQIPDTINRLLLDHLAAHSAAHSAGHAEPRSAVPRPAQPRRAEPS